MKQIINLNFETMNALTETTLTFVVNNVVIISVISIIGSALIYEGIQVLKNAVKK